jgi:predicted ABC-type transport system involved in lysophospholipase L1 biosynthesis ATPase subunit
VQNHNTVDHAMQHAALRAHAMVHELPPLGQWALALATALVCEPSVALIDAAPDGNSAGQSPIADAIEQLRGQGAGVLVVLDPEAALRSSCQRILELRDGTLAQEATRDHAAEASFAFARSG